MHKTNAFCEILLIYGRLLDTLIHHMHRHTHIQTHAEQIYTQTHFQFRANRPNWTRTIIITWTRLKFYSGCPLCVHNVVAAVCRSFAFDYPIIGRTTVLLFFFCSCPLPSHSLSNCLPILWCGCRCIARISRFPAEHGLCMYEFGFRWACCYFWSIIFGFFFPKKKKIRRLENQFAVKSTVLQWKISNRKKNVIL